MEVIIYVIIIVSIGKFLFNKRKWDAIPSLEEYKEMNPHCVKKKGIRCVECGSKSIYSEYFGEDDRRLIFICNHCGKRLYKVKRKRWM
jgi:hypothetical protein